MTQTPEAGLERVFDLPADTSSPGRARAIVVEVLGEWGLGPLSETAALLVSEVVTNGVRHAGTWLRLALTRPAPNRARVAVTDLAPSAGVQVRPLTRDAEGGRGLYLIDRLADAWGSVVDESGKTVWFELQG